MSLLLDIQKSVTSDTVEVSSLLLKVQLLAAKLGNKPLQEWVHHESQGYPAEVEVPNYRKLGVSYVATFSGPFGSGINNATIPPYLIKEHAGEHWNEMEIRSSISEVDGLVRKSSGSLQSSGASNLILLLNGKVYPDYSCVEVKGNISSASVEAIQHAIKSKVLELTIELETSFPEALEITLDEKKASLPNSKMEDIGQMTQKIIFGNNVEISSSGDQANVSVTNVANNIDSMKEILLDVGLNENDADEIADIIANEKPISAKEPLGKKAQKWLAKNLGKAADGTWNVGATVATKVISEAALKYYGLKE